MKKLLLTFASVVTLAISVQAAEVTDVLTQASVGNSSNTTYASYTYTGKSGAGYNLQCAGDGGTIQIRSNSNNSGIVVTKSAGNVKSVSITVNTSKTTINRTIDIYGSSTAYTDPSNLYATTTSGTKLGSITYTNGTSTAYVFNVEGDYPYIGIRSNSGAVYLSEIDIVWETDGGTTTPTPDPSTESVVAFVASGATYSGEGNTVTLDGNLPDIDFTATGVCTFTLKKAATQSSTSNVTSNAVRWYKGDNIIITPFAGITITGIKIQTVSGYSSGNVSAVNPTTGWNGYEWTGSSTSAIEFSNTAQVRFTYLEVTYTREEGAKADPALNFASKTITVEGLSSTGFEPKLTCETDATPLYTSSNEKVALVNSKTGAITLVNYGTTTITATAEETATYAAGTASYTLTVLPSASPYTVTDALTLIANGFSASAEVRGYIVKIDEIDTEGSYGNATYYIADSADEETKANMLEVYRGYGLNGEKFNAEGATIIEIGAIVTVSGTLVNYNGTYEFTSGSKITEYSMPTPAEPVDATPTYFKFYNDETSDLAAMFRPNVKQVNANGGTTAANITDGFISKNTDQGGNYFTAEGLANGNTLFGAWLFNNNQQQNFADAAQIYDFGGEIGKALVLNGKGSTINDAVVDKFGVNPNLKIFEGNCTQNFSLFWLTDYPKLVGFDRIHIRVELNAYANNMASGNALTDLTYQTEYAVQRGKIQNIPYADFATEGEWDPSRWMVYEFEVENNSGSAGYIRTVNGGGFLNCSLMIRSIEIFGLNNGDSDLDLNTPYISWNTYEMPEKPDFGNPAIEGEWALTLDWHYAGDWSLGVVEDIYTAKLDGNVVTFTDQYGEYPIVAEFTAENTLTFKKTLVGSPEATYGLWQNPFVDGSNVTDAGIDGDNFDFAAFTAKFDAEAGTISFTEGTGIAYGNANSQGQFSYYSDGFDFISAKKYDGSENNKPAIAITSPVVYSVVSGEGSQTSTVQVMFSYVAENIPANATIYAIFAGGTFYEEKVVEESPAFFEFDNMKEGKYSVMLMALDADGMTPLAMSDVVDFEVAVSGICGIMTEGVEGVRYFNLKGVEIANPTSGNVYIRVEGGKAVKVIVP